VRYFRVKRMVGSARKRSLSPNLQPFKRSKRFDQDEMLAPGEGCDQDHFVENQDHESWETAVIEPRDLWKNCPKLVYIPSTYVPSTEKSTRLYKDCSTIEQMWDAADLDLTSLCSIDFWREDDCAVCGLLVVEDGTGCECPIPHCYRDGCACHYPSRLKS